MKDIREMLNISYFDNKELSLKEHCDIYSNIKNELISILNKYDIKYVLAETEAIKDLSKENQELKKQLSSKTLHLETQQKEFIEYLEKEKERCLTFYSSTPCMYAYDVFKDVLLKYKEIIGVKDER